MTTQQTAEPVETFASVLGAVADNMARAIQGKDDVIELVLLCLVSEGHLLLEDVPGVGKTTLAKALAASLDASFGRVQFTPDVLPTDVLGVNVWDRGAEEFRFRPGPVFANIVLADEINRASPKTQSALLESMAEGQVTIDGTTYPLPPPFLVVATQNPIEHEGTYPLPESQLDRFLLQVSVGYPGRQSEIDVLNAHGDHDALADLRPVTTASHILALARAVRSVFVAPPLQGYLVDLAAATRAHPLLALGMSPRATLSLQRVARARAAMTGRAHVLPDDVKALAEPVLAHRLILTPEARLRGATIAEVLHDILSSVAIPSVS